MPVILSAFALVFGVLVMAPLAVSADTLPNNARGPQDKFRQLDEALPTPNRYRSASGAPGPDYWQQKVDYRIAVRLDEQAKRIRGDETVTYHNNSPDTLTYLWVQLDQNRFAHDSKAVLSRTTEAKNGRMGYGTLRGILATDRGDFGNRILQVTDAEGHALSYRIEDSYLRIDLPTPLAPRQHFVFRISWEYHIPQGKVVGARGGYEEFDDGNAIFFLAQWYPRLAAYTDYGGWRVMPFLGAGEFTVEFGDFDVSITVPADHLVAATGSLANPREVLSAVQRKRLEKAKTAREPVFIVTPDEAKRNEKGRAKGTRTWHFRAEKVRDFAFASSRKFIWDAKGFRYPDGHYVRAESL
ncbi:MAG: aminopeptidase, partial [Alphaproteobacteria bacterium]